MRKIFFTADLHIGHANILRHSKERIDAMGLSGPDDIEGHDKYIEDMWLSMTKRGDHIYVLGDFIMKNKYETEKTIHRLKSNGCRIHLITGNHDKSSQNMTNMFESIDLIRKMKFPHKMNNFIEEENFNLVLCHYPMLSWDGKPRGSMNLYGHVHANSLFIDDEPDLRLNVGLDNPICNYRLISLEDVYRLYKEKLNGLTPDEYIEKVTMENKMFVR